MSHSLTPDQRWLIAIDIDGTLVHDDGYLSKRVIEEVERVRLLGHEVVVATGRSAANALPVIVDIGLNQGHAVCSNGAVTIEIDPADTQGFRPSEIITFDPAPILKLLIERLPNAHFAVEDIDGTYRYHRPFPAFALGEQNIETPVEQLMHQPVSRVVVLSPEHAVEEFLNVVAEIGLHSVSYSIGYTAWLDIAPLGVTKASALEKLRRLHDIRPDQIITIGDGRNDIPMFEWAQSGGGLAFAMGQGAEEAKLAATALTASVTEDGVAKVLEGFEGILFTRKNP
jgi:Cof subfamily protein (haloacid dehalogenase superfamily)